MRYCFVPVATLAVFVAIAGVEARTWINSDGKFSTEAELVGFKEGKVQLRKINPQLITVPLEKLSEADRRYVKAHAARPDTDDSISGVEARTWTSFDGTFSTEAELVGFKEGKVQLRKINPQLITVPLEKLSEADQRYVKAQAARPETHTQQPAGGNSPDEGAGETNPQTCTLELKRLKPLNTSRVSGSGPPPDHIYRMTRPQNFFMQVGVGRRDGGPRAFAQAVKKEPAEYESEHPFRGLAKLGSRQYAFVLDSLPAEPGPTPPQLKSPAPKPNPTPSKSRGYGRLYFDLNHNGDLTDDKVIEAIQGIQPQAAQSSSYSRHQFPRVDLTIDVDGTKVDYSFFFSVYSRTSSSYSYISASLNAAAYREGRITLNGKRQRIVLIDYNSNGRFDDEIKIRESGGRAYTTYGDTLLVDPGPRNQRLRLGYDVTGTQVSKLVNIDGRFYDPEISVAGDKLTLTPSAVPVGHVTSPNEGFLAVVYSDQGVLSIGECASKPAPLPEGNWKLASYTIVHGGRRKPPNRLSGKTDRLLPQPPRYAVVSAGPTKECKAVEVRKGETVALPFGPPYKPIVKASPATVRGGQAVRLGMSLVGSGGEVCSSLMVNGKRPEKPEFTISTPDGEEVASGKFEWG